METRSRVPAGSAAGGQFAPEHRHEPRLSLRDRAGGAVSDAAAMDGSAVMLGSNAQWDGVADYLEDTATFIAETGRPHPGDQDPARYRAKLSRWILDNPAPAPGRRRDEYGALNRIALHLGQTESWSADELDLIAAEVERTGRPSVDSAGADYDADGYEAMLERWHTDVEGELGAASAGLAPSS